MISNSTPAVSAYARAVEPEPSVTITDATFFGHGWQPTTIATLQAIWFMPQGMSFTVDELAVWFGQLGWKSTNGRPFGQDGVRRELALIRQAGYIQAVRLRGAGGKVTGIRYEISKRARAELPAASPWIPIQTAETENPSSDHVPSPTGDGRRQEKVGNGNRRSHHVPSPTGHGGRAEMVKSPSVQVAPCAAGKPSPPHPPEEVETSSPYPLKQPAAPTEEEADFTADEIRHAEQFLQLLPAPWTVGRKTAQRLAPKLLEAITAQGWNLDDNLQAQLASNPDGIKRHASVLEKERIADLPLRSAVLKPATQSRHQGAVPANWPAWCEDLDCDRETRRRSFTNDQGFVYAEECPACHPDTQTRQEAA
ncbi:hypothetical protein [Kitasatospora sp. NPDC057223]|uniref:hypothetical protein n=1 Tax=Kitasatospora sp. NPDC057223 TaxID=3346055 RepID=UPI00363261CB